MWYQFKAWNSNTLYGYTDSQAVVAAVLEHLNRSREINVYSATELTDAEALALGVDDDYSGAICTQDTTVSDYADEA